MLVTFNMRELWYLYTISCSYILPPAKQCSRYGSCYLASQLGSHPTEGLLMMSHCNLVYETNLVHKLFSTYFIITYQLSHKYSCSS